MRIGILGSGVVGQALAKGFLSYGYEVMIGTGNEGKLKEWNEKNHKKAFLGNFEKAAEYGEIIVLAVKGLYANDVLKLAGRKNLSGKTIIDATNPIEDAPPENGVLKFFTKMNSSLMEELQLEFPEANFVKSFSCIGHAFMVNPSFKEKPTMFICGNDEKSKSEVIKILDKFGFIAEDMGKAESARAIEPLCVLWCIPGFLKNEWQHAFRLVKN